MYLLSPLTSTDMSALMKLSVAPVTRWSCTCHTRAGSCPHRASSVSPWSATSTCSTPSSRHVLHEAPSQLDRRLTGCVRLPRLHLHDLLLRRARLRPSLGLLVEAGTSQHHKGDDSDIHVRVVRCPVRLHRCLQSAPHPQAAPRQGRVRGDDRQKRRHRRRQSPSWVQPTVTFPIGDHVNVLHDYKKTGPYKIR